MTKIQINNEVRDMTAEEQAEFDARQVTPQTALASALAELRNKRNKLLSETDYLGASDNTMSSAMTTYRQALRDLPNGKDTVAKCTNATWPTKP
jgi:hypothetical protein